VHQLELEERQREQPGFSGPLPALLRKWLTDEPHIIDLTYASSPTEMGPESEMKYLTMSWWLLHVGWKDVGERVRRAVEEVFDEYVLRLGLDAVVLTSLFRVSLKEQLSPMELHRLLIDVRRRVEHEVTFEGIERRIE
jgi:peroxin-3